MFYQSIYLFVMTKPMLTGMSEDEYRFYHYQPVHCAIIYCDTSEDEEDNAFQQITSNKRLPEVDIMKEPAEALESQSQMTTIMTTTSEPVLIDGGVSSSFATSSSSNNNNKRDYSSSSALQLSVSSSDLSAAMAGNAKNKNVRTSYVPHMRTRATWSTDLVGISSIIIIPSIIIIIIIIPSTGQSPKSPGRTEQSRWLY